MASLVQVHIDKLSVTKTTWGEQCSNAININGGDLETAKKLHIEIFESFVYSIKNKLFR